MIEAKEFRSMEEALADLLAKQERTPDPKNSRMIELLQAEIQHRETAKANPSRHVMEDCAKGDGFAMR